MNRVAIPLNPILPCQKYSFNDPACLPCSERSLSLRDGRTLSHVFPAMARGGGLHPIGAARTAHQARQRVSVNRGLRPGPAPGRSVCQPAVGGAARSLFAPGEPVTARRADPMFSSVTFQSESSGRRGTGSSTPPWGQSCSSSRFWSRSVGRSPEQGGNHHRLQLVMQLQMEGT